MEMGDIVIAGLPSDGLRNLAGALDLQRLEEPAVAKACNSLHQPFDHETASIAAALAAHLGSAAGSGALVVYPTPWGFLEQEVATRAARLDGTAQLEAVAQKSLGVWVAYHGAVLQLRERHQGRCLLLNGSLALDPVAIAELVRQRLGARPGLMPRQPIRAEPDVAAMHEEAFWQLARELAPDCLEIYALLESCVELMGREPRFGADRFTERTVDRSELLARMRGGAPVAPASRQAGVDQAEAELNLLQLHRTQLELAKLFELQREKDRQIADLKQRLRYGTMARWRRIGNKIADVSLSTAARLAAPLGYGERIEAYRRIRTRRVQASVIRSSGLFDEAWYRETYPDIVKEGYDPIDHYLRFGVSDGRNPSAQFDTVWYLRFYRDVAQSGINPLLHYVESGRYEGRRTGPAEA